MKGKQRLSLGRLNFIAACMLATIFVLFSFALLSSYDRPDNQSYEEGQATTENGSKSESWRHFATKDPAGLFTLWLVFVGFFQAGFFVWQLDLIRRGLADTKEAADASKEQARLARESLIASQRAWIKVSDVELHEPLFVRDGRASTSITFRLKNVGNAPGLQIAPWIRLGVVRRDGTHVIRFNKECEEQRFPPPFQAFLFPGEVFPSVERPIAFPAVINREDFEPGIHQEGGLQHVMPLILGCILYRFPTDPGRIHQTRFIIEISRKNFARIAADRPRPLPLNELALGELSWEDYSYAD